MAEEEVVAVPAPPSEHKRKLDEVVPDEVPREGSNAELDGGAVDDGFSQVKRPKLGDEPGGLDIVEPQENGSSGEKPEEHHEEEKHEEEPQSNEKETEEEEKPTELKDENPEGEPSAEVQKSIQTEEVEEKTSNKEQGSDDTAKPEDNQKASIDAPIPQEGGAEAKKESTDGVSQKEVDGTESTSRRMEVPSSKVGVLIGKGGDTIRYLQFNSGAKIQILRDAEADPNSALRPVEIIGTIASIEKAEKLIHAVIAEAEAGGSPALVARGLPATNAIGVPEQIEIKVPNDKVGLIIGRGGETIKNMQTRSGARIQLIPQHTEGDESKERTVRISGDKRQIDIATEMIKDVMFQSPRSSHYSGGYNQPVYRPRGPSGPPQWGSRGPHGPPPMPYDYHHRGPYPSQGSHYNSPSYGGYPPQHMPPRSGYGAGWDQRPPHMGTYDYYGRQGSQPAGPLPSPATGPAPGPSPSAMGPPPSQANYGYGQSHGPEYGHAAPYSQWGPQQTYGQMYEQPKYDNPPMQPPYGGHGGSQPGYPQAGGGQQGYAQQQQPGRPYGMQGPTLQGYGPPRAAAPPGDMSYQGATPTVPSYGAPQQQYAYPSGAAAPMQSYPSYGSGAPTDGYSSTQAPASSAPAYQQQSVQPGSAPDQSGAHQATAGYGQVPPTSGYSSYPTSSQQVYGNAPAQASGSYGLPGSQDPSYGSGNTPAYASAPAQTGYEQPTAQPTGYATAAAAAPGSAPVKSYPQYDANQAYAAPR
ncbi:PREDICTED: far upstream element-binding protein 1 isoform X3 [Tarenaya hassleriana]|uniref:far upstream element-binding protein 1 isoform X1 n=1 Tax=Tarenaya hassleriana TaxID=28532 RepID=UPI00053C6A99|nr:PREDICTED: far upstream element-binding protein 1 isoform X1 [Tarenaya hassleriana]XP_010542712.1 PREDICTED: far upstream element-binding protein 1 isoform X2 [Tarenaya hassleriana]XP_010542721.1 PREDICTED: far upstream element-binding protein 1 isoform X4 [Tarenaya hassleriana]XP_019058701.1 PREDICTED: far upstream element-binding protein 1 isoform X3 [Tarenaya hassleriana]